MGQPEGRSPSKKSICEKAQDTYLKNGSIQQSLRPGWDPGWAHMLLMLLAKGVMGRANSCPIASGPPDLGNRPPCKTRANHKVTKQGSDNEGEPQRGNLACTVKGASAGHFGGLHKALWGCNPA